MLLLVFLLTSWSITGTYSQFEEGSGSDFLVDEYWLQRLIENVEIPTFLRLKAYEMAKDAKEDVDEEEILTLDASVPDYVKQLYSERILNLNGEDVLPLKNVTDSLMTIVFHAFRPFGCDQDNIWPSVYNLTRDNVECIGFTLLQKIYARSEFTRKYFARAVHYGLTSTAPMDHRIHEMSIYQFLLPNSDRVWFNDLKIQLKNSFWNEQEISKMPTYEDYSFVCGSIPFTDEVQGKINFYYTHRKLF